MSIGRVSPDVMEVIIQKLKRVLATIIKILLLNKKKGTFI